MSLNLLDIESLQKVSQSSKKYTDLMALSVVEAISSCIVSGDVYSSLESDSGEIITDRNGNVIYSRRVFGGTKVSDYDPSDLFSSLVGIMHKLIELESKELISNFDSKLESYITKEELEEKLSDYVDSKLESYITKEELEEKLSDYIEFH